MIALGGIVCNKSIRIAGDDFNADIMEFMRKQHNILMVNGLRKKSKLKWDLPWQSWKTRQTTLPCMGAT